MVSSYAYLRLFYCRLNYSLFCHFAPLEMYKGHINFWMMPCTSIYAHAKEGENMHKHTCKIELRFVLQLHTCYVFK